MLLFKIVSYGIMSWITSCKTTQKGLKLTVNLHLINVIHIQLNTMCGSLPTHSCLGSRCKHVNMAHPNISTCVSTLFFLFFQHSAASANHSCNMNLPYLSLFSHLLCSLKGHFKCLCHCFHHLLCLFSKCAGEQECMMTHAFLITSPCPLEGSNLSVSQL